MADRAPAPRRNAGRMVDGRHARTDDRPCRYGRARIAQTLHLSCRAQLQPGRFAPRAPAHQCGRGEPQSRMGNAERRKVTRSARYPKQDGRNRCRLRDGCPWRRGDPGGLPRRLRGHTRPDRRTLRWLRALRADPRTPHARLPDREGLSGKQTRRSEYDHVHHTGRLPLQMPGNDARNALQGQ